MKLKELPIRPAGIGRIYVPARLSPKLRLGGNSYISRRGLKTSCPTAPLRHPTQWLRAQNAADILRGEKVFERNRARHRADKAPRLARVTFKGFEKSHHLGRR